MSTQMVQFHRNGMPTHLASVFGGVSHEDLTTGAEAGFPVLSLKGKVWRVTHGGEQRIIQRDGEPVPSLDVVLVAANKNLSKLYYSKAYAEGDDNPPDCSSANGVTPDAGIKNPQSNTCATCPNNAWGSKITEQGKKTKACGDSRRMAIIPEKDLECKVWGAPLLLRIPAGTFQALTEYAKVGLGGADYCAVVTRIGFDMNVAFPKLTFRPLRWLTAEEAQVVARWRDDPIVARIIGTDVDPSAPNTQVTAAIPSTLKPAVMVEIPPLAAQREGYINHLRERIGTVEAPAFARPEVEVQIPPALPVKVAPPPIAPPTRPLNRVWAELAETVEGPCPAPVVVAPAPAPVVDPLAGVPEYLKAAILAVGGPETDAGKAIMATIPTAAPAPQPSASKRTRRTKAEMVAVAPAPITPAPVMATAPVMVAPPPAAPAPVVTEPAPVVLPTTAGEGGLLAGVDELLNGLDALNFDD